MTQPDSVSADQIVAKLAALCAVIGRVQINGRPLASAVRYEGAGKVGDPIEVIVAPPAFTYGGNCLGPTGMIVEVFVVAVASDLTVHNLIALERGVADAIDLASDVDNTLDCTVIESAPGVWRRGGADLPAYVIRTAVTL